MAETKKTPGIDINWLSHEDVNWAVNEAHRTGIQFEKVLACMLRYNGEKLIERTAATIAGWDRLAKRLDTLPPGAATVNFPKPVPRIRPGKTIRHLKDPVTGEFLGYEMT